MKPTLILTILCLSVAASAQNINHTLKELDKVVENRAVYAQERERRITEIKVQLIEQPTLESLYQTLDRIEEQYRSFSSDSSFVYVMKKRALAQQLQNEFWLCASDLNLAQSYSLAGLFAEAEKIFDKYTEASVPFELRLYYWHVLRGYYGFQVDYAVLEQDITKYNELLFHSREKLVELSDPSSDERALSVVDLYVSEGLYDLAEEIIEKQLAKSQGSHDNSYFAYLQSKIDEARGDVQRQKYHLALTAINDIKQGIREYQALFELAFLLYNDGEVERAYKYLQAAMEDASLCNARLRYLGSGNIFATIDKAYDSILKEQRKRILISLTILCVIAVLLIIVLALLFRRTTRLHKARKALDEANTNLNTINEQLSTSLKALAEASATKEEYLGMYMDQCLDYISMLDAYRKSLRRLLNLGSMDELSQAIKSGDFVEQEFKEFYSNFDKVFLNLFPTFVDDFNALLKEPIEGVGSNELNPTLRIYALVRLGIEDSDKIAKFLRYSLSTIYNYRTQIRNKAVGDRDKFESAVKTIGKS